MGDLAVRKARLCSGQQEFPFHRGDLQCILTLALCTISMDGRTGQTHVVQVVVDKIRLALLVHEYQRAAWRHGHQQVVQALLFQGLVYEDDLNKC